LSLGGSQDHDLSFFAGNYVFDRLTDAVWRIRMNADRYLSYRVIVIVALIGSIAPIGFSEECHVSTALRFINEDGQPVTSVTADQVRAKIGGGIAKITSLTPNPKPLLVLLIDNSSSIKGTWKELISAAKQLANAAGDNVAAVVFRDRIVAVSNGPLETAKLLDALPTMTPQPGGTTVYDTLIEVAGGIKTRNAAIVLIGDGEDNASHHSSDQTAKLFLQSSWPPVFGLILDYDQRGTRRGYFKKIVDATGGTTVIPSSASKVAEAASNLSVEVFAPFNVKLQFSGPILKPTKLKVEVIGPGDKPLSRSKVLHVSDVQGCDSTESSSDKQ
jgi:hypothetical protein